MTERTDWDELKLAAYYAAQAQGMKSYLLSSYRVERRLELSYSAPHGLFYKVAVKTHTIEQYEFISFAFEVGFSSKPGFRYGGLSSVLSRDAGRVEFGEAFGKALDEALKMDFDRLFNIWRKNKPKRGRIGR